MTEFDGFEMRAIGKACPIPGEGLGAVIVGVELIDGSSIMTGSCEPDDKRDSENSRPGDDLAIDGKAAAGRQGSVFRIGCYPSQSSLSTM
jgi:hypothetical protein